MNRRQFLALTGGLGLKRRRRFFAQETGGPITVLRSPYLQSVSTDRASILWATAETAFGAAAYSPNGVQFQFVAADSRVFQPSETNLLTPYVRYQADLRNLLPNTEYLYRVTVDGELITPISDIRFRTAGPGPLKFAVIGDSGMATTPQAQIANLIAAERPAFMMHVGDIAYLRGTFQEFQTNHFNYYGNMMSSVAFFPCPGNHEYETQNAAPYLALHAVPSRTVPFVDRGRYYSFDWANVHFVSLDSNSSLESAISGSGPMLQWLEADLAATRQFWRVAYFHHPPYAGGPNSADPIIARVQDRVVPILERYGVQVVFSGHEHSYQRSESLRRGAVVPSGIGTTYFTAGGGGAFLYPVFPSSFVAFGRSEHHYLRVEVSGTQMKITAVRTDGSEIENVVIRPQPAFTDNPAPAVSFSPDPTQGALVTIRGRNLAEESFMCTGTPPEQLGGVEVRINGQPIWLWYVARDVVYGQLPFGVAGSITARVSTPNGFAETSVSVP
jgi:hypothetical protein